MQTLFWNGPREEKPRKKIGCLGKILIAIGIYVLLSVLSYWWMMSFSSQPTVLEDNAVYKIAMKGSLVERAAEENPFASLLGTLPTYNQQETVGLDQLLSNIRLAKEDSRVEGIWLDGGELAMAPASAKTLRDALADFKASGKWVIAYAQRYGELNYYVASIADAIYLNPVGSVEWHGFGAFKMYYTRLLEKLGVEMQVVKVGTFKSAVEPFIRTSMSEADRRQTKQYVQGLWDQVVAEVGAARGLSPDELNRYADEYMELQPQDKYLAYKMVDSLVYVQEMDSIVAHMIGTSDFHCYSTGAMANVERAKVKATDKIAILYADGEISDESGDGIVGTKMVKTIAKIHKDESVKAVVLRVNSPGGSADASEQIWHAVQTLKQKGLPVVVSMGDYAASGGYYISCGADYIFAEPTTITGSIGIFGLIPNAGVLRDKIGIDIDALGTNKHTSFSAGLGLRGMTGSERAMMQKMVERGYDLFTSRCAQGRHMPQDEIKKIGEGRVWLGNDALELGLVDELGNIEMAIAKAADLAGLTDYKKVAFPEKKDYWTEMMEALDPTTDEEKMLLKLRELCKEARVMMLAPQVTIQ
ncbi:MAG: signal peptide peptidase SppA [Paludibacteraceae bacterium]|nr:signal peptide peptidase SppA [Paludibacteraceae bacterium]